VQGGVVEDMRAGVAHLRRAPAWPWQPEEVVLVIGDGVAVFDEEFPYDERVYFHFDNAEQYETAKTTLLKNVGFVVLRELEED
jgi:hypothetical protein